MHHNPITPDYTTIQGIGAWSALIRSSHPDEYSRTIDVPLKAYEYLIPDLSVKHWSTRGINFLTETRGVQEGAIAVYRLHQITHYHTNPLSKKEVKIWDVIMNNSIVHVRGISLFFKSCNYYPLLNKIAPMVTWETDLNQTFTLKQWQCAIAANKRAFSCIDHWNNTQKVIHRWYMTPMRLHTFYPNASEL